jgi:hypothetical protein
MQAENGEILYCDVEIKLNTSEVDNEVIQNIINQLEELGAPKGSILRIEKLEKEIAFGKREGIGIYLDGVNLDEQTYQNSDINYVISQLKDLTGDTGIVERFWEGNEETGLYLLFDIIL